jgi:hypothetical protein
MDANPVLLKVGSKTFRRHRRQRETIAPTRKERGGKTHPGNREAEPQMHGIGRDHGGPSQSPRRALHCGIVGSERSSIAICLTKVGPYR